MKANSQSNIIRLRIYWLGSVIVILSICALLAWLDNDHAIVATVNGEPIQEQEFLAILNQNRGDRSLPVDNLKQTALNELVRIKVIQLEGKKRGLSSITTYSGFLDELTKENMRRNRAIANEQVIFGPKQYNEQTYYSYLHSNLIHRLKDHIAKHDFPATESKLREFYNSNKEKYAARPDKIKVKEIIEAPIGEESLARIHQIKQRLDNGESFEQIYEKRIDNAGAFKEEVIDETNFREFSKYRSELTQAAMNLKVGEISEIIQDGEGYYLILCIEREKSNDKRFEDVRTELEMAFIDQQFEQWIAQMVSQANVQVTGLYDEIGK